MSEYKCVSCGCTCAPAEEETSNVVAHAEEAGETQFAVLLALVPAMTMTLFNMMGLL